MRGPYCLILLCALVLPGCATVQTRQVASDVSRAEGVTYYLPKRDLIFSGTRTPLKRKDVEEKITKASDAKKKAEDEQKTAESEAKAAEQALKAPGLSEDRIKKLKDDQAVATYRAGEAKRTAELKGAELNDLNALLTEFGGQQCVFTYEVKIELGEIGPDTGARFVANLAHSPLRDDEQTFKVTTQGLLTSADVVAEDRTDDIIVEAVGAFAAIAKSTPAFTESSIKPAGGAACDTAIKSFRYYFDPLTATDAGSIVKLNDELEKAGWPFSIDQPALPPSAAMTSASVFTDADDCPRAPLSNVALRDVTPATRKRICAPLDGLVYRTALPVPILVRQCVGTCTAAAPGVPVQASMVVLPQAGPVSYVPMQSSAFVKTTDNLVFENGMLTSWTAKRPSEVLEVVRLPVRILKALISVPAEIFQLKIDYSSKEKGLAEAYAAQVGAQERLAKLKLCLDLAEKNGSVGTACLPVAD